VFQFELALLDRQSRSANHEATRTNDSSSHTKINEFGVALFRLRAVSWFARSCHMNRKKKDCLKQSTTDFWPRLTLSFSRTYIELSGFGPIEILCSLRALSILKTH
jgi:hypothetical protein